MLKYLNGVFFALTCSLQILYTAEGMYINPVYDYIDRSKRDPTTVCVQIKPNGAGSYEPYFMCKDPQFSPKQINVPPGFENPTGENYANLYHPQAVNIADLAKPIAENNQQVNQPQTLQFGNAYERQTHPSENGENINTSSQTVMSQYPPTFADGANHQHNPAPSVPLHTDFSSVNPSAPSTNNNEAITRPSSDTSTSDTSPNIEGNQHYDGKTTKEQGIDSAPKHGLSPEQFNALLEEEVLGTPNLAFSPDEMLPIQNMYSKSLPEMPLMSQGPQIPPEYFDDPVLRAFYNIDRHPAANIEEPYLLPTIQENNPVLQEPAFPTPNINQCLNSPMLPKMFGCMPPTESTYPLNSNKCFDFPYTFQPIFIAIPWISAAYSDLLTNKGIKSCGQLPHDHIQHNLNKGFYRSQSNENIENTSTENLSNKSSSKIPDVKTTPSQAENNSTKDQGSSEEDLFVEDATTKADKVNKHDNGPLNEDIQNKNDEINASTTSVPSTTAKTFKTMLHAAKMHAMRYQDPNAAVTQAPNKRHIPYMVNGAHPGNYRRQYVRKLEKSSM